MSSVIEPSRLRQTRSDLNSVDADRWWTSIEDISATRCVLVDASRKSHHLGRSDAFLKRSLDLSLAMSALVLLFPILLIIALCIRMDSPGPVLFRQQRNGRDGDFFRIFKFRTMRLQCEERARQATRYDSRVTRIGRLLRRTSLDELPQLLNVVQGSMSLVGPRPHPLTLDAEYRFLIPNLDSRYSVKPGITGWAQINGHRGETRKLSDMINRVEHDCHYIRFYSLRSDISILLATLCRGWIHENAY